MLRQPRNTVRRGCIVGPERHRPDTVQNDEEDQFHTLGIVS